MGITAMMQPFIWQRQKAAHQVPFRHEINLWGLLGSWRWGVISETELPVKQRGGNLKAAATTRCPAESPRPHLQVEKLGRQLWSLAEQACGSSLRARVFAAPKQGVLPSGPCQTP